MSMSHHGISITTVLYHYSNRLIQLADYTDRYIIRYYRGATLTSKMIYKCSVADYASIIDAREMD